MPNITFSSHEILKIIQNLGSENAHAYDRTSTQMLKICGPSISKPLESIFKSCLESGIFLLEWKKANVVPVHKKMTISNKLLADLTSFDLWKIIWTSFNEVFDFFITNHLIFRNQSDFKPGESCINQLLSMAHGIHGLFDKRYEVWGVFFDISNAFDISKKVSSLS